MWAISSLCILVSLFLVTATSAKQAQKQSGFGVKDKGYAGAQNYGPHLPKADYLFLLISDQSVGSRYPVWGYHIRGARYQLCSILIIMEGMAIHIFIQ